MTVSTAGWQFGTWVAQDWEANRPRIDSQLLLAWFRTAQWADNNWPRPMRAGFRYTWGIVSRLLGFEIPIEVAIGPRLRLWHYFAVVVHSNVTLGADCQIRQGVTIGNRVGRWGADDMAAPTIGDGVEMGAFAVVIGGIGVGEGARIGAHAVLTKSVPPYAVVIGNPGQVIKIDHDEEN